MEADGVFPAGLDLHTWQGGGRRGPVNVLFRMPRATVVETLVEDGWRRTRARRRQIVVGGRGLSQDVDLVQGSWWGGRTHLRLWDLGTWCVGQAHDEVRVWDPRGGRPGHHEVLSQDVGRDAVAASFVGFFVPGSPHGTDHDGRVFVADGVGVGNGRAAAFGV